MTDEYAAKKAEYEKLTAQLVGYSDEDTQKIFTKWKLALPTATSMLPGLLKRM